LRTGDAVGGSVDATPADVKLLMEIRDLLKERQEP
jgi:large-conductance mechanosensitive channel